MTISKFSARVGVVALVMALAAPSAANAQISASPIGPSDPAQALSENLKALARDPYNVDALIQAGYGALSVGDANAAFGFFARAEELSPSNSRAKAGLGSALTQMEKPKDALRAFEEATALGAGERDILADRGLAYDLSGDARRAQKDYLAALKTSSSDELTRRLALSLGISGDRDAALARLDPLVRRNDQAAWRARAFVLAMNGDTSGAEKIVRMVAPPATVGTMVSFLQRLAALSPSARASAVHFGTLPSTSTGAALASADDFRPMDTASAARLATPTVERAAVAQTIPISAKEAKKRAREQDKLAKLAERGRKATGSAPAPVTVASAQPVGRPVPSEKVSARVAAAMPQAGDKVTIVKGATALPLPDAIASRPALGSASVSVAPSPSVSSSTQVAAVTPPASQAPSPLFEVPAASPPPAAQSQTVPSASVPAAGVSPSAAAIPSSLPRQPVPTDVTPPRTAALLTPTPTPSVAEDPAKGLTATTASVRPVELPPAQTPQSTPPSVAVAMPVASPATSALATPLDTAVPAPEPVTTPPPPPRPALTLADIVNTLELEQETAAAPLPNEAQIRAARLAAQKKAAADEKLKAEKLAEEKRVAEEEANARRNPARIWVQVATGNNRSGLPGTWRKLQSQAGKSLSRQAAWTAPFRQTNRLLVGPMKSVGDARELVNSLAKEGIQATTFSSEAGQEISRIGGR